MFLFLVSFFFAGVGEYCGPRRQKPRREDQEATVFLLSDRHPLFSFWLAIQHTKESIFFNYW